MQGKRSNDILAATVFGDDTCAAEVVVPGDGVVDGSERFGRGLGVGDGVFVSGGEVVGDAEEPVFYSVYY